jgi:hypothetical protein
MKDKICFKCQRVLPISDFYVHSKMADGHLGKCKDCTKMDVLNHRTENIEKIRKYDRDRALIPNRRKRSQEISKRWLKENPEKARAQRMVHYHVSRGNLTPQPCRSCGAARGVAHHEDYTRPLDVVWLCQPCHKARHKEILEERKNDGNG